MYGSTDWPLAVRVRRSSCIVCVHHVPLCGFGPRRGTHRTGRPQSAAYFSVPLGARKSAPLHPSA